ncbi:MAG: fumarylacetoacetate hydrolase family protein [Verrucomicrobiota bacterium]
MQLLRYSTESLCHWGELRDGTIHELVDINGVRTGVTRDLADVKLLAPCDPKTIVCVGRNYVDHIREFDDTAEDLPTEPGLFLKSVQALAHPGDPIPFPNWTKNLHYEGELAVVIGRTMKNVSPADAADHVLGYTAACDVTARDKQRSDMQWTRAKSADGFCPVGPWLETELDPSALALQTRVNGELKQDGNTRDMIFDVPTILSYISTFLTLVPGDLVLTGTPEGVGPLQPGDRVEVSIEGVGTLVNLVAAKAELA